MLMYECAESENGDGALFRAVCFGFDSARVFYMLRGRQSGTASTFWECVHTLSHAHDGQSNNCASTCGAVSVFVAMTQTAAALVLGLAYAHECSCMMQTTKAMKLAMREVAKTWPAVDCMHSRNYQHAPPHPVARRVPSQDKGSCNNHHHQRAPNTTLNTRTVAGVGCNHAIPAAYAIACALVTLALSDALQVSKGAATLPVPRGNGIHAMHALMCQALSLLTISSHNCAAVTSKKNRQYCSDAIRHMDHCTRVKLTLDIQASVLKCKRTFVVNHVEKHGRAFRTCSGGVLLLWLYKEVIADVWKRGGCVGLDSHDDCKLAFQKRVDVQLHNDGSSNTIFYHTLVLAAVPRLDYLPWKLALSHTHIVDGADTLNSATPRALKKRMRT